MCLQCVGQDQVQPSQGAEDGDGDELYHNAPYPQPPAGKAPAWQSTLLCPTANLSFVGATGSVEGGGGGRTFMHSPPLEAHVQASQPSGGGEDRVFFFCLFLINLSGLTAIPS